MAWYSLIFATQYPLNTEDEKRIKVRLSMLTEGIVAEQAPDEPVKTSTLLLLLHTCIFVCGTV